MNTVYCKNCNYIIGEWHLKYKKLVDNCNYIISKNYKSIYFLDCENCNKFVGIKCYHVCITCFGKDIIGENNLFNWFLEYRKILNFCYFCKKCYEEKFRWQYWFFNELTFYK